MKGSPRHISRVGGVVAAAGGSVSRPTLRLGAISIIQRIVITYQQAGIFPIVVVTGVQADEVRYQLAGRGVVFLHNDQFARASLFDSARLAFRYLQGVCGRVVFTPVNSPLVAPACLRKLIHAGGDIARLSHGGRGGHPVSLSGRALDAQDDRSPNLRDAMAATEMPVMWVEADNEGAVLTIHQEREMHKHLARHKGDYFHPHLHLSLENEEELFPPRLKTLLFLVTKTNSVAAACRQVALSTSSAWEMLNRLEDALGYAVVVRKRGGASGSGSALTARGLAFLRAWQRYEESVHAFATSKFDAVLRRLTR